MVFRQFAYLAVAAAVLLAFFSVTSRIRSPVFISLSIHPTSEAYWFSAGDGAWMKEG